MEQKMHRNLFLILVIIIGNSLFSQTLPGKFGFGADLGVSIFQGQSKPDVQPIN